MSEQLTCKKCRLPIYEGSVNVSCEACVEYSGKKMATEMDEKFRIARHRYYAERAVDEAFEKRSW